MRYFIFISVLLLHFICSAQCTVHICQSCGQKELIVFYKDGSEGAEGTRINDSCISYRIPVTEPYKVAVVDDSTRLIRSVWIDPRFNITRKVLINNCTGQMSRLDTIPLDIDDAPDQQILDAYTAGRITSYDSVRTAQSVYELSYINAHPDSFLSVYYLQTMMRDLSTADAIRYRDMVKKSSSQYSALKSINSYIENASYRSVPKIGDPFLEFKAKQAEGSIFDSKTISDRVIVLFFWYTGCGPCHRVMPALCDVYAKYKSQGLDVISFALDTKEEEWIKSSAQYKIPGINVCDMVGFSGQQFLHYGVSAFPFFVVFDRNKKISMITFGDEVPLIETKVKELLGIK